MIRLRINGEESEAAAATVAELLAQRGIDPAARFLAVAVNGAVVRRAEWATASLSSSAWRRRRGEPQPGQRRTVAGCGPAKPQSRQRKGRRASVIAGRALRA